MDIPKFTFQPKARLPGATSSTMGCTPSRPQGPGASSNQSELISAVQLPQEELLVSQSCEADGLVPAASSASTRELESDARAVQTHQLPPLPGATEESAEHGVQKIDKIILMEPLQIPETTEQECNLIEQPLENVKMPAEICAEAPAETPAEILAEAPAEPLAGAPAEAPAEILVEAPAEPLAVAPAEALAEAPAEALQYDMTKVQRTMNWHEAASAGEVHTLAWHLSSAGSSADLLESIHGEQKHTAIHEAAFCGHLEVCLWLINHGSDVSALTKTKGTALHLAAQAGHLEVCKLLLEPLVLIGKDYSNWPDASATDLWRCTALHRAAEAGHDEVCLYLIQHSSPPERADREGDTPLHKAIVGGCTNLVAELLKNRRIQLDATNKEDYSPLDLCVKHNRLEAGDLLLQAGGKLSKDIRKNPPTLLEAARRGLPFLCSYVLRSDLRGGDKFVNSELSKVDDQGRTAMLVAIDLGHLNVVRRLMDIAASNAISDLIERRGACGLNPLHQAASSGQQEIVSFLLEHAAVVDSTDSDGRTALFHASMSGHLDILQALLARDLLTSHCDHKERVALHAAAAAGQAAACKILLEADGEECLEAEDWEGATPAHFAICSGSTEACQLLADRRADLHRQLDFGVTPLQVAAEKGHEQVLKLLLSDLQLKGDTEALVEAISFPRVSDGRGAWLLAASEGHLGCCKCLWDSCIITDSEVIAALRDRAGRSAIILAAREGHVDICSWLVESRAFPAGLADTDSCGWTALHAAAAEGRKDMVDWLLRHNADPFAKDEDGKTPREWSALRGHAGIEALLKKAEKDSTQ